MGILHSYDEETMQKLLAAAADKGHDRHVIRVVQDGLEVPDDVARAAKVKLDVTDKQAAADTDEDEAPAKTAAKKSAAKQS